MRKNKSQEPIGFVGIFTILWFVFQLHRMANFTLVEKLLADDWDWVSAVVTCPYLKQITSLSQYVIKKVAVHSGGRHAMALTVDGKVFSWGEGDDGKLGHFSRVYVFMSLFHST